MIKYQSNKTMNCVKNIICNIIIIIYFVKIVVIQIVSYCDGKKFDQDV